MNPTLLALASLFSQRYADYEGKFFPKVHKGVTGDIVSELAEPFDFVIVGTGFAGSFLAQRLSESRCMRILVLEAGKMPTFDTAIPFAPLTNISRFEWGYYTVPQRNAAAAMKDKKVHLMAGKVLGGDSVVDNGLYIPPNLDDFHRWSYLYKLRGWSYVEMKPYMFKVPKEKRSKQKNKGDSSVRETPLAGTKMSRDEIQELLRKGGNPNLLSPLKYAWLKGGLQLNYTAISGQDQSMFSKGGFFVPKSMSQSGLRMNSAAQFLKQKADNLMIITHAEVSKLLYAPNTRRVVGLEFRDTLNGRRYHVNAIRETILSAGTIGSAQILMQSGIGPEDLLTSQQVPVVKDLPVGERLNDRVTANIYLKIHKNFAKGMREKLNDPKVLHEFLINGTGILANTSVVGCGLVKTGVLHNPDLMLEMKPVGVLGLDDFMQSQNYREEMLKHIDSNDGETFHKGVLQISITVLRPFSTGTMWIWRRHDDSFQPRMNPSYLLDERDVTSLVQGIRHVEAMVRNEYMAALGAEILYPSFPNCPKPLLPTSDEYWKCALKYLAGSGNHLTSTVPLGSVVDSRLRVKGMSGIRVIDQSVFPETASGGVTSTVLAVANRGYRIIYDDHRIRCFRGRKI